MTQYPSFETAENIKTTIVVYAHKLDDKNLFLLFKQNLNQKVESNAELTENWEVLHEEIASSTEDAQSWLASYLGVSESKIDMQRVKYVQEGKSKMERVLVFKAENDVLDRITGLNPNSKWVAISEIPKLLSLGRITQQLCNLIANIQTWRIDLNKINHLKFEPAGTPYVIMDSLVHSQY